MKDVRFSQNVNVHALLEDLVQERVGSSCFGTPKTPSGLNGPMPPLPTSMPATVAVMLVGSSGL